MARFARKVLFIPPGVEPEEVSGDMVLPGSNIVVGPYAGHAQIKEVEFVKSSGKAKDCPKDGRPEFSILGRSNVGKSSLINALVRKKEVALTSKKPGKTIFSGLHCLRFLMIFVFFFVFCLKLKMFLFLCAGKTQLINHFLVNRSWYIVDLPGYG